MVAEQSFDSCSDLEYTTVETPAGEHQPVTREQKPLSRIRANPKQVRFRQLVRILEDAGFEMRRSRRGTSHHVFIHDALDQVVVLVSHGQNDFLPEYQVRRALAALDKLATLGACRRDTLEWRL